MQIPEVGQLLNGRYRLLAQLGEGSGGLVFRARDEQLDVDVAVKLLFKLAGNGEEPLWMKEADIALRLRHEGLVSGYALQSSEEDFSYLVMELLPHGSLEERVRLRGAFSPAEVIATLQQLAAALAHMHANGLLHRDIKPSNILYSAADKPKLADFGIARVANQEGTMTRDVGTQNYAAPEQLAGHAEVRSDLFSLGAVGYFMLNGSPPPPVFDQTAFERAVGFSMTSAVPMWLLRVIHRCLDRSPEGRPASADELLLELSKGATQSNVSRRQLMVATIGVAAMIGAFFALQYTREAIDVVAQPIVAASRLTGVDLIGLFEGSGLRIGTRPLYIDVAIRKGDLASVQWLLESKPERVSDQALLGYICSATSKQRPEILRYLVSRTNSVSRICNEESRTPLGIAVERRDRESMRILLAAGADPNIDRLDGNPLIDDLAASCSPELLRDFVSLSGNRIARPKGGVATAVALVLGSCPASSFEAFVQGGGAVNEQDDAGNTVLHLLTMMPVNPRLEMLLHADSLAIDTRNAVGRTPLLQLLVHPEPPESDPRRFERVVELFIARGADLNAATGEGITPTMYAAMKHRARILQMLLESGRVNLDQVDGAGRRLEQFVFEREIGNGEVKLRLISDARARQRK